MTPTGAAPGPDGKPSWARALDLALIGALLIAGFALRVHIAQRWVPEPAFAIGPDSDDWAGVFQGAAQGMPFQWDQEWAHRYPLLPLLALVGARATGVPFACAALWISLLVGSLVAPLTYLLGLRLVGRQASLAAGAWMVVQDGLTAFAVLTTAYPLVTPIYLLLLIGLVAVLDGRRRGWLPALAGSALLTAALLQGVLLVGSAWAAAVVAWGVANLWRPRRWGALLGVTWPCLVGVALGAGLLMTQAVQFQTPWGDALLHVYQDTRQTAFHDPRWGMPTGHQVQRLVEGWSRGRHLLVSLWEMFNLPLAVLGPLVIAGGVALVLAARRGLRGGRILLLLMLAGTVYGFVANSEDFHVFQWFPTFALVVAAGLGSWSLLFRGRAVAVACWLGAAALIGWQVGMPQRDFRMQTVRRYMRVESYQREARFMRDACVAAAAPVSLRGTLLVGHPHFWGNRAFLNGASQLVEVRTYDPEPLPALLPPPVYLLSAAPPAAGTPPALLLGCWHPVAELRGFVTATLYRLGTCVVDLPSSPPPQVLSPAAGPLPGRGPGPGPGPGVGPQAGDGIAWPPAPGANQGGGRK